MAFIAILSLPSSTPFKKRGTQINQKALKKFVSNCNINLKSGNNFVETLEMYDKNHKKVKVELSFTYVKEKSNNITYVLITKILD